MVATLGPVTSPLSISTLATQASEDNSKNIIIIWQKSTISDNCRKALGTIGSGVHIWDAAIDGFKLDAQTFAKASYNCLVLWAGNPASKTAAQDVHQWYTTNRQYIKDTGFTVFVVKRRLFSWAGLKSVYEEVATGLSKLPKWSDNLEKLLLNIEEQFPTSEYSVVSALVQKFIAFFQKK